MVCCRMTGRYVGQAEVCVVGLVAFRAGDGATQLLLAVVRSVALSLIEGNPLDGLFTRGWHDLT